VAALEAVIDHARSSGVDICTVGTLAERIRSGAVRSASTQ
jgi:hypothetical protein